MLKERCTLYHLSEKDSKSASVDPRVTTYHVALDSEYVQHVIKSVSPDAIIFFGAFDDHYFWPDYHRCSAKYVCDLTNILVTASDMNVKKFIYLSTVNVYGFDNEGEIDETHDIAPSNVKSIIVAQGERLCKDFSDREKINAITLRFGTVYGDPHFQDIHNDYIMKKCLDALVDRKIVINNQTFPVIAVSDAAIAVYKAVSFEGESDIFNVCDSETISDAEIVDIIMTEYSDYGIELQADESFKSQSYNIAGEKFKEQYLFFQKVQHREGIQELARFTRDNLYRLRSKKHDKGDKDEKRNVWFYLKFLFKKILPFLETVILFALFVLLAYIFRDNPYLNQIDFMLLCVIIVSITFGKTQAVFFIPFALAYYIYMHWGEQQTFLSFLISYEFIVQMMLLFIVGMIIGHTRDKLHEKINDNEDRIEYLESEYEKLDEINDVTVSIKQVFEERLIAYGDSLAKNYSIIEKIDSLIPYKIYMNSLDSIRTLLKSENVCIYTKTNQKNIFSLEFWTTQKSKQLGSTLDLYSIDPLYNSYVQKEMMINKNLDNTIPLMASYVLVDNEIEAILMVWDVDFEALTMHHINLFTTLTKIITNAAKKSVYYKRRAEESFKFENHININEPVHAYSLSKDDFVEAINLAKESKKDYKIPFSTLSISLENLSIRDAILDLQPILNRVYCMYKSSRRLEILFNNSNGEEINEHLKNTVISNNAKTDDTYLIAMENRVSQGRTDHELIDAGTDSSDY